MRGKGEEYVAEMVRDGLILSSKPIEQKELRNREELGA